MSEHIDPTSGSDDAQALLQAFLNAEEFDDMQAALEEYPALAEPSFEQAVDRLIEHAGAMGDAEAVLRIQDRLELLYDALDNLGATPLEEAVEAFLNAETGEESAQVYADHAQWLDSPKALAFLDSMEAADAETAQFLAERRAALVGLQAG